MDTTTIKKDLISKVSSKLLEQHHEYASYPCTDKIIGIIKKIRTALFPGYFCEPLEAKLISKWHTSLLKEIYKELKHEIKTALLLNDKKAKAEQLASDVALELLGELDHIQELLIKDAEAGFKNDPAARSIGEVILTYPGFFAVYVYRIAHFLFTRNIPFIPRMMSEHSHSVTGIDIHPGAVIGEYFFIDHGTGVVIGETTVIGSNVKLYQGVTLGAISTKSGQKLAGIKRHPTIEDNVTIYSGTSILGGETVIGKNSTIGGNVFIVKSVQENTTVKGIKQEST